MDLLERAMTAVLTTAAALLPGRGFGLVVVRHGGPLHDEVAWLSDLDRAHAARVLRDIADRLDDEAGRHH